MTAVGARRPADEYCGRGLVLSSALCDTGRPLPHRFTRSADNMTYLPSVACPPFYDCWFGATGVEMMWCGLPVARTMTTLLGREEAEWE